MANQLCQQILVSGCAYHAQLVVEALKAVMIKIIEASMSKPHTWSITDTEYEQ